MGVDYSTTVGYGIYGSDKTEHVPAGLKKHMDGNYLGEEHMLEFISENGLDLIEGTTIGNWMSGPTFWFFCLKRTYLHFDHYDQDGVHTFSTPRLSAKENFQLERLRVLLGGTEIDNPQWVVAFNVS
jgi:hypothetical protein